MNITIEHITKAYALYQKLTETAEKTEALWEKAKAEEERMMIAMHNGGETPEPTEIIRLRIAVVVAETKKSLVNIRREKAESQYERFVAVHAVNSLKLTPEDHDMILRQAPRYQGTSEGYPAYQGVGGFVGDALGESARFGEIPIDDANTLSFLDIDTSIPA